jgi:uncharacterized RDD family membrane protein YckC
MKWYYTNMGAQVGPISEKEFQALVREGKIKSNTKVWNSTMSDWQDYGTVAGGEPQAPPKEEWTSGGPEEAACSECGRVSMQENMIRYGDTWVCGECKPIFVQKLKEGVTLAGTMEYAGFWIRFGAKVVDWIIVGIVNTAIAFMLGIMAATPSDTSGSLAFVMIGNLFQFVVDAVYTTWFVGRYGATLGKMICRIKVVTADGGRVSYANALGRYFAAILSGMILLIGYIMAAFDDQKRALHDRICNTRVVRN